MRRSLLVAFAVLAVANAVTLLHVATNRGGTPEASITLDSSMVSPLRQSETSVDFTIQWQFPDARGAAFSRQDLERLGFDCSLPPSAPEANAFYRRQPSRQAFVALRLPTTGTSLTLAEAAVNADALRGKYPDANHVLILPAILTIQAMPARPASGQEPARVAELTAIVDKVPTQIHVPRPFSEQLQSHGTARFRIHLNYGAHHEPWVTGVDFPTTH